MPVQLGINAQALLVTVVYIKNFMFYCKIWFNYRLLSHKNGYWTWCSEIDRRLSNLGLKLHLYCHICSRLKLHFRISFSQLSIQHHWNLVKIYRLHISVSSSVVSCVSTSKKERFTNAKKHQDLKWQYNFNLNDWIYHFCMQNNFKKRIVENFFNKNEKELCCNKWWSNGYSTFVFFTLHFKCIFYPNLNLKMFLDSEFLI